MPHPLFSHLTEPADPLSPSKISLSLPATLLIVVLSVFTISGALVSLFGLDYEVTLFLRSLHLQTFDTIGRLGNQLGHGSTLVALSIGLGCVGYAWNRDRFKRAGWHSLLAHGLAGLITQLIKHLLGRPRPRLMHQDQWEIGPSFASGLDTFPSGHSAASFAVAAVLARHFPQFKWLWYGTAGFVAISRMIGGSHFPSDILAGSLIGFLVGFIWTRPLKEWFVSLIDGLIQGLPFWVGGFAMIWLTFHIQKAGPLQEGMFLAGLIFVSLGVGIRAYLNLRPTPSPLRHQNAWIMSKLIIGLGLALYTESVGVTFLALSTGLAYWVGHSREDRDAPLTLPMVPLRLKKLAQEGLLGVVLIGILIGIQQVKGIVPLQ